MMADKNLIRILWVDSGKLLSHSQYSTVQQDCLFIKCTAISAHSCTSSEFKNILICDEHTNTQNTNFDS